MPNIQPENTNLASKIATNLRANGMSTVEIMRALYKTQYALGKLEAPKKVGDKAIALDGKAAQLHAYLSGPCREEIESLSKSISDTQYKVDQLSTVKTAAQLAANYGNLIQPIKAAVSALQDARLKEFKELEEFIKPMRQAFIDLGNDPSGKKAHLDKLLADLDKKRASAYKLFDHINDERRKHKKLDTDVTSAAAANGVVSTSAPSKPNIFDT